MPVVGVEPDNTYVLQAWAVAEGAAGETQRARDLFGRCTTGIAFCLRA